MGIPWYPNSFVPSSKVKILNKKSIAQLSDAFLFNMVLMDYFSIKISMIVLADLATGEPGPKIAATPALYKKS